MKTLFIIPAAVLAVTIPALAQTVTAPTTIADLNRDSMVTLKGVVERITDRDEFLLRDGTGLIEVDLGSDPMPVREGDVITVQGRIDDDDAGPLELYARILTLADGTVITVDHDDKDKDDDDSDDDK